MNEKLKQIDIQIKELRKKKIETQKEIKKNRDSKRKEHICNGRNNVNQLIRVSIEFNKELEDINAKREENGLHQLSKPELTRLFVKHKGYKEKGKEDIINYNPKIEENVE